MRYKKEKKVTGVTFVLCRKLLSAPLASSLDDKPATLCLHSLTKAVGLLAPMIIRLIRSLHLSVTPPNGSSRGKRWHSALPIAITMSDYIFSHSLCQSFSLPALEFHCLGSGQPVASLGVGIPRMSFDPAKQDAVTLEQEIQLGP